MFAYSKVGGLHFVAIGKMGFSFHVKRKAQAFWTFPKLCVLAPIAGYVGAAVICALV